MTPNPQNGRYQQEQIFTAKDETGLRERGIDPADAARAGIVRVDEKEGALILDRKIKRDGLCSGLSIPYFADKECTAIVAQRIRLDIPMEMGQGKKPAKYLQKRGSLVRGYFPYPFAPKESLADISYDLIVAEGEFKALSLQLLSNRLGLKFLVVAIAGVNCWSVKTDGQLIDEHGNVVDYKQLIADLRVINWKGRKAYILFDADSRSNVNVRRAADQLFKTLQSTSAQCAILEMPSEKETGCKGIDDLIGAKGDDFVADWLTNAIQRAVEIEGEKWEQPQAIPDGIRDVPELSESLIPEALRGWLCDIAERLQVAPDFPAVTALCGLGSVIGAQVRLRPKQNDDWQTVPNLWGMIVGPPSAMKSPAMAQALKPLYRLNHAAREKFQEATAVFEFAKEKNQAQREAQRKQMRKALDKDPKASLEAFEAIAAEAEPAQRRYLTNDVTVEKLGELLEENPNGLLIVRDELTGFLNGLEDESKPQDRPFYLSAWESSEGYDYQRITRGSLWIPNVTISIFGGIQPSKIAPYLRKTLDGSNDDGLMQRFQMSVYPTLPEDWKYIDRWPDTIAKNRAYEVYEKLADFIPTGASADDDGKSYLNFTGEAQELFVEWYTDLMRTSRQIEHPAMQSHWLKYAKLMPSLALIFHLSEITGGVASNGVPLHCAEMAAAWCDYLWEHAQKIYGVALNAEYGLARSIVAKLQKRALKSGFTARDLWVKNWTGLDSSDRVKKPLDILVANHWLREIEERHTKGGRPTIRYEINPRIQEVSL